ncbi:UNVERIFIED_CONTAM: hypothetical protein Sradi_1961500 [Sesamum radiatum]|uniref:Uncharacterized protein n=1 Tax=Sesamum radiatum TaxID=300843 RepID=A0AAW2TFY1_SESRA
MVYDNAAIKLRGPDALTNFNVPPTKDSSPETNPASVSGYDSGTSRIICPRQFLFSGSGAVSVPV